MKHLNKFRVLAAAIILTVSAGVFAEKTSVENLYQYTLDNGLTVFEAENHAVPLVYIEIAVRTGAKDQTPETVGLFHLYEHMMFKGNALYKDAAQVQHALSELGVTNWNGTTGTDCVNYFFTIPSDRLEEGLAFWNAAIRSPKMDRVEFENEKKVVLSEIEGDAVNPDYIFMNNVNNLMFPEAPYRLSPGGSSEVVKNATVAQLVDIKERFYIPSNAALFIGGDINPDETIELVKKIWGTWSNNGKAAPKQQAEMSKNPLAKPTALVMPYDKIAPQIANVTVSFRGPDTDFDLEDTYTADYLCQISRDPESAFVQDLYNDKELVIPGTEYIQASYQTVRQNGLLQFTTVMMNPETNMAGRSMKLLNDIQDKIFPKMANDKNLYTKGMARKIARTLEDEDAFTADTATDLLTNLRFWWIATSPEYYYSYNQNISGVTQKDMQDFIAKYITGKNALVSVIVNPLVYEATKAEYEKAGFIVADAEKAAWWDNPKYKPDPEKVVKANPKTTKAQTEQDDIYIPNDAAKKAPKKSTSISEGVKVYALENGIPVYVKKDESKRITTLQLAALGGIEHLTPETSGLENALYHIMSHSSERYDFTTRQILEYQTLGSISANCTGNGSFLSLNTLDTYFDQLLPVMIDGFLNPKYDQQVYSNMMTEYANSVQNTLNNPEGLLAHNALKEVYKGHPYEARVSVTPDSLENITVENMKNLHQVLLNPSNLMVVAAGNIDEKKLLDALNQNIGKLKVLEPGKLPAMEIPELKIKNDEPVILTHDNSKGTGFVFRFFEAPPDTSDDYIPAELAADIYSNVMFSIVRESHGVCYTPMSYVLGSKASVGLEELYSLSNYVDFSYAMDNARQLMALGMIVNGTNQGGSYSFDTIENVLESYKNKLINSTYSSQATTAGIASVLTTNLMAYGNLSHADKQIEQLRNTTADQIRSVFQKYWIESPERWFVIVGPEDKDKVMFKDY